MQYRTLGKTGLRVSVVGFGTTQLRRVGKTQAIDTLIAGFDRGVNIVHTAPDYEGAEELVAAAVARTPHKVIVASNGYDIHNNSSGPVRQFEKLFEATCRKLRTDRLDLFGIASVEDRENLCENVWGREGMVEFLQKKKAQGRLGATFCTCHGKPEFSRKLIESGAFDAVMLACNDLGFHLLTLHPPSNSQFEDIARTRAELIPLCRQREVGLMVMLPLGGGLFCQSKAFPRDPDVADVEPKAPAADALRSILADPAVSCVLPGTASVAEAKENALAGHSPVLGVEARQRLEERVRALQTTLCSRCGRCEELCSRQLPVSWLFRAGHMALYPSSPYETWEDIEYFRLQPRAEAACSTCDSVTCACPAGIDIPGALIAMNEKMVDRMRRGQVQPPVNERVPPVGDRWFSARLVTRELPAMLCAGQSHTCRICVENHGLRRWHPRGEIHGSTVELQVYVNDRKTGSVQVREKVIKGRRCHFVFDLAAPRGTTSVTLRLQLSRRHLWLPCFKPLVLLEDDIPIGEHS
jgi:predicted aldo/keto reductase-like oxidoreductase